MASLAPCRLLADMPAAPSAFSAPAADEAEWGLMLPDEKRGMPQPGEERWTQPRSLPDSTGQLNWLPPGQTAPRLAQPSYLQQAGPLKSPGRLPHRLAHQPEIVKRASHMLPIEEPGTAESAPTTRSAPTVAPMPRPIQGLPLQPPKRTRRSAPQATRPHQLSASTAANAANTTRAAQAGHAVQASHTAVHTAWQDAGRRGNDNAASDVFDDVLDEILPGSSAPSPAPSGRANGDTGRRADGPGRAAPTQNPAGANRATPGQTPEANQSVDAADDPIDDVFGELLPEDADPPTAEPDPALPPGDDVFDDEFFQDDAALDDAPLDDAPPAAPSTTPAPSAQQNDDVPSPSDRGPFSAPSAPAPEQRTPAGREPGRIEFGTDGEAAEPMPVPPGRAGTGPMTPDEILDFNGRDCESELMSLESAWNEIRELSIRDISLDISPTLEPVLSREEAEQTRLETIQKIPSHTFRDAQGNVLATGKLRNLVNGMVIVEQQDGRRKQISWYQLSNADLCFVSAWWELPTEYSPVARQFEPRDWTMMTFTWTASALCHKPLYFEEVQLERYGHTAGPLKQTVLSGAHFFGNIFFLPYHIGLNPPNECQYTLGYYRPGNCAPWLLPAVPLDARAARMQLGAVIGGLIWIP